MYVHLSKHFETPLKGLEKSWKDGRYIYSTSEIERPKRTRIQLVDRRVSFMAPKRKIPGYKPLHRRAKPATDLQATFRTQEEQDYLDMVASAASLPNPVPDQAVNHGDIDSEDEQQLHHGHHDDEAAHGNGNNDQPHEPANQPQEPGEQHEDIDEWFDEPVRLSPEHQALLADLNSSQYQAKRLEIATRWELLFQQMLDTFLICRQKTSEWGDDQTWNQDFAHDFEPPTHCRCQKIRRDVCLVDLHSEPDVFPSHKTSV